ncbi:hypothetical protein SAMN05444358_11134 [Ruegeria halocynthiae]|uniref:Uncharacterized protein n=1 Tax=Ruegeria halocynthiae TaxID=985054 RepID=A0A1H3EH09_9RHOB|nr:hypothetical protein SAMN05444358_11134 [Ruegeria halocynthiae]
MLNSVLTVLAGILFELGYLWSSIPLDPERVLAILTNNAQYLTPVCVAALRFLYRDHDSSREQIAPVLNARPGSMYCIQRTARALPGLDDMLVDRLFLLTQGARSGRSPVRHSTAKITARSGQ